MYPLILAVAILPVLLVCWLIFRLDKYEHEPRLPLILTFLIGVLITIPALFIEVKASETAWNNPTNLWLTISFSFFAVSFVEEIFKLIGLLSFPFHRPFFNEPMDGIVYSMMIGMGFATFENIMYANQFGLETTIVRALTAVPAHGVFAIFMGYFVGQAKFNPEKRIPLLLKGFGITVLLHGTYDFFILQELFDWLIIFALIILAASIFMARRMILHHQRVSPFREEHVP
jgi:RsiW-degrading membrane proteinase PrsW (M82 family)